jgi:hypothetical protein
MSTSTKSTIQNNFFITIDKELIYNYIREQHVLKLDLGIQRISHKNEKMSQEFFLYEVENKERFMFAAMKFNIPFTPVNIEDYE